MDIDANLAVELDRRMQGKSSASDIRQEWQKFLKGRCSGCGAKSHANDSQRHKDDKCKHCGRTGHWERVCLTRLLQNAGISPDKNRQRVAASVPEASSSGQAADVDEQNARLQDTIELLKKELAELRGNQDKGF